ncbi:unnamed protein product [Rotaria sp. Silwood1]|nr:unnamed protein product [Rotaria sp. Silwood1]CAF1625339.1 unnamed protein product [Rotaria sp. Silwood1]CAF3735268.1 unnamed protein product [Rotaria sp. Silwood1]CAF3764137.1 unnamed protein product [Rotaria sp. Silwood1]CAF3815950.1 unnamed protein product [Rotaria sp. Silwood1]
MATPEESLFCPITFELFTDPVLAQDGHTYERQAIEEWIRQHGTSPITRQSLSLEYLYPNILVRQLIDSFEQSTRNKNYQFTLGIDVKKRESQPFIQTFGKSIYRAQWLPTNRGRPEIILLKIEGTRARKEASFYVDLSRHPYIVRTFGLVYDTENNRNDNSVMLLQEYAPEGNLFHKLQDCSTVIYEEVFIEIFLQIIDAMAYLTHNNVIHGDLACRNVLVFRFDASNPRNNHVKLTDFGISRNTQLYSMEPVAAQTRINIVPIRYAAPEILSSDVTYHAYTEKSDIYSMGVLMWEAYKRGEIPWSYISDDEEVIRHVRSGQHLLQPPNCTVGDFNNDTILDIVVVNRGNDTIGIFLGWGNGFFSSQTTFMTGFNSQPNAVAVGDFNNDTLLDIIVAN